MVRQRAATYFLYHSPYIGQPTIATAAYEQLVRDVSGGAGPGTLKYVTVEKQVIIRAYWTIGFLTSMLLIHVPSQGFSTYQ